MRFGQRSPGQRGRDSKPSETEEKSQLNRSFARGAAKVDGFVFEIVNCADVSDGATTGAHENRMGDGLVTDEFDPG